MSRLQRRDVRLTTHRRIPGNTIDKRSKHTSNSNSSARKTNGSKSCSLHFGGGEDGCCGGLGDYAAGLHGVAEHVGFVEVGAEGIVHEEAMLGCGGLAGGQKGAWEAGDGRCWQEQSVWSMKGKGKKLNGKLNS